MIQRSLSKRSIKADAQCVAIMSLVLCLAFRKLSQPNNKSSFMQTKRIKEIQSTREKAVYNSFRLIMTRRMLLAMIS
jgi:hypothetical protein